MCLPSGENETKSDPSLMSFERQPQQVFCLASHSPMVFSDDADIKSSPSGENTAGLIHLHESVPKEEAAGVGLREPVVIPYLRDMKLEE